MHMHEEDFGASFPSFSLTQPRVARGRAFAIGSALLLLACVLTITGCGVDFNTLPTVSLSPASISIHKVDVGATSGAKVITITNTSPVKAVPLSITAFNITTNFIQTGTTCPALPATLASGASCTVSVAFRPTTSGNLTGTFSLTDNATNTPAAVQLSAPGGIGFLLFNPTSLSFPGVAPMSVSQPQTSTLTNEATYPVQIAKFTVSGKFSEGDDCPRAPEALSPGGSCTVTVTSNPTVSGNITGSVNVEDEFGNITQLYLSGSDQGLQNTGELMFSPASLVYGKVTVGQSSGAKTITVTNLSPSAVNFSSIGTGPDFTISASTCGTTLGGGASCTVSVVFRPTIAGSISELLTFNDNLTGSPQALSLRGTGVVGDMLFTPTSLLFAGVNPGQASPAQSATLTNETTGNISLSSITVTGKFAQTNNCPATLGPQASCTFEVTADPVADGTITGSVNVKDNLGNTVDLFLQGQGGGTNQVLSFSPNPIVWGKVDVGQSAASKTLTVDNGQTVPVTFYSISVGQDFVETASTCPTAPDTLAAGSSCTVSLAFRPLSAGAKSEVITFTDDAPGGNQSVSLMGTGVVGSLLFNPTSLSFAGVDPNSVSQAQTATLTNEQTTAVTLASITVSGHFAQTNNCGGSLGPGASCTFTVTSNPVIDGPTEGSVNVKDGSGNTTQLYLSGIGGVPVGGGSSGNDQVALSPTSLAFGSVDVGQTSGASAVTLSNGTTDDVTISSITAGPDIYETANTCPIAPYTLAGGASCAVSVTFRPQSVGAKSELLTFTTSAWSSPQSATITGTGVGGNLLFSPTSLTFSSMAAGSISQSQTATLTNQESGAIAISSIKATGTFLETNDCPTSPNTLAAGASCTVSVSADPATAGSFTGTVDATDSTGAVTQLYLSGTATAAVGGGTPPVTLSPTTLNWGDVAVGSSSGVKTVTLQNNQTTATTISSVTTGADFAISQNSCGSQVAAGGMCTVSLIFRPTSSGAKSEPLTFTDNAGNSPQTAVLSGTGTVGSLLFTPGSLTFAATAEYSTSAPQTATLTNKSGAVITLSSITVSGAFGETNNCPTGASGTFAAGASCTVSVTTKPTSVGSYSGSVNVKVSSGSGTTLTLNGTGTKPNTGAATLSPASKTFTSVYAGSSGSPVAFTLTNKGATAVAIFTIATSNTNFTQTNNCGSSLAGNGSCTISVSFTPQSSGSQTATLTVTDDASNNPQTATLSGTAMVAPLALSPTSLSWGSIAVGASSGAKTLTLTNSQASAAIIDSITVGPDFYISANGCPASPSTLAGGTSCTVSLEFRPASPGAKSETITFNDDAANSPQTATLTGTGTTGSLLFSPGSLTFAATTIGSTSASQTATLTNDSGAAITLTSITVSGPFAQTNNCSIGSFAAGASCTVTVTSKPTTAGSTSGAVNVHVSSGSVTELYLSGSGANVSGTATLSPASNQFKAVASGSSDTAVPFTLTNNTSSTIAISQIGVSNANFTETNNCGKSLAGNASCTISVTFAPQSVGSQTAMLSVTDDASNSPQTATLSGTGLAAPSSTGSLKISPDSYTFPNQATGTTSPAETLTVTNSLTTSLTISSIKIPAPFSETNNCGTLAGGASCTVSVTYAPTASGYTSADLTFTYNAAGSPQTVFIAGNSGAAVTIKPGSLGFSPQIINTASSPQTITITNNQSTAVTITSITTTSSATPSPFSLSNTCIASGQTTGTLAANSNCTISVTFEPTKTDTTYSGSVSISYNAPGSPGTVTYTGSSISGGTGVRVTVAPQSACIEPSQTEQFTATVSNTSNTAVNWFVDGTQNGTSTGGTISTGGLYTAPSATGTHTVKAVSQANTNDSGSTTIMVTTSSSFAIYPFSASLPTGGQQTFQAQICGAPDTDSVSFAVDGITGGNATVGTITQGGVYTAPGTAGKHVVKVTDSTIGKSSSAAVTVYAGLTVDFGSRTNQQYPIPAGILGANHVDDLRDTSDISLLAASGMNVSRTYALIPQVYATQTPDWTQIDPRIKNLQAAGMHVLLEVEYTPPWLQPNPNPCGAGNTDAMPTDVNAWANIAASYVAHFDAMFPGVVTDYEIGNEPDADGLCGVPNKLQSYETLYAAAASAMKNQAQADGQTIRVGGPAVSSPNAEWISGLLSDSSTYPYVDFVSYHSYMEGTQQANATWDTYNGITPLYQQTQSPGGAAAAYAKVAGLVAAGKQPLGAKTPIYIDEYNTNWAAVPDCCRDNPTYAPLWNALFVSDLMNTVYSGTAAVPGKFTYFSANAYPYFCLIGTWDSAMDCEYSQGGTPVPYPQYYAYQLMGSSHYLDMNSGGYMAASAAPAADAGGIILTGFYTANQDSVLVVNPTAQDYSNITVTLENVGLSSPQAVLYQIVNGNQITSSSLQLTPSGTNYTATISVPAYTVVAIAVQ